MLKEILKNAIDVINNEGWNLPDNIKIKIANDYYKDKPFSPSYVDRNNKTIYVMSSVTDPDTIKKLVFHELLHLTDMKNYEHAGKFEERTNLLNKKYHLGLPMAAEDMLDKPRMFIKNPGLKKQAYQIVSRNSGIPISQLTDKEVYKGIPNKLLKENYFPY